MNQVKQRTDTGFVAIVGLIVLVVIWLLLTPVWSAVPLATMRRFHLASGSFARWAAQFPIPAMYNFANRYEASHEPPGPDSSPQHSGYLNHFSARVFTFADGRYKYLREGKDCWFVLESDYRGNHLESRLHLQRVGDRFVPRRIEPEDSSR